MFLTFYTTTINCLLSVCSGCTTCLIQGDWNLTHYDFDDPWASKCIRSREYVQFCLDLDFKQLNPFPTRGSSILDLVLCNDPLIISKLNVGPPVGSSDHDSLTVCIIFVPSFISNDDPVSVVNNINRDWSKAD